MFNAGLILALVIVLDFSELFWTKNGLIMKEAIEFESKLERWDVDVQLGIDCILAIEMEFERWI